MIQAHRFEWLIRPIAASEFFKQNWERVPLYVQRNAPDYYMNLLNLHTVDEVLTTLNLDSPEIRVASSTGDIPVSEYTTATGRIEPNRLCRLFDEGVTIILDRSNKRIPALGDLCETLTAELSYKIQAHIYLTPSNSQGFLPHFDDHNVFVLQVAGSKSWKMYDTPIEYPLRGMGFYPSVSGPKELTWEGTLEAGDMLYVPRGVIHSASATDQLSLHISIAVGTKTWAEFITEAFSNAVEENSSFRKYLPPGFASPNFDRSTLKAKFSELAQSLLDNADPDTALDSLIDDLISTHNPRISGQIQQILNLGGININSVCAARPNLLFRTYMTEKHVHLLCRGTEIILPWYASEAIKLSISGSIFRVSDLPGGLDDRAKVTIVRRLVREAILEVKNT